jgi:hypothetical protein
MATASQTAAPALPGLFDRKVPPRVILFSFPLLTVPLVAFFLKTSDHWFVSIYLWLFGLTHFVLTPSVYLHSENLKYFRATARNIFLFFVIPLTILMGFYVIGVFQLNARFPAFAVAFGVVIRLLDFNHLNRQTFGVYQMFKARTGLRPPPAVKQFEQAYLFCLTGLLIATFLAGGVCPLPQVRGWYGMGALAKSDKAILPLSALQIVFGVVGCMAVAFAAVSVTLLIRAWKAGGRPGGIAAAFGYMGIQTAAALLAIVSFPLYFATLATHYVEYHVMMFPRCFHSQLDDKSGLDRWFGGMRRHRGVFYAVIVGAAGIVLVFRALSNSPSLPIPYRAVVSIFDGLFVFHYFVEMLIWRFSNPFFRKTLTSLYFTPRLRTTN